MAKKHKFSHTDIEFHDDGSSTIHHVHESGDSRRDVKHAVADMDGLHDSLQEHLNPEKVEQDIQASSQDPEALEEQVHPGIHADILKLAGKE